MPNNILDAEPNLPDSRLGQVMEKTLTGWMHTNPLERPAVSFEVAQKALAEATNYLQHKDFDEKNLRFFAPDYNPAAEAASWPESGQWAADLTARMMSLPPGKETDDHSGTPIGAGETIALVGAKLQMDKDAMAAMPDDFRTGLFAHCRSPCPKWPGAMRVSHTEVSGTDIMRIALKFDTGRHRFGEVDLHFTETMRSFPIADKKQLEAFMYSLNHGPGVALTRYPRTLISMGFAAKRVGRMYRDEVKKYGVAGKDFFSLTAYKIGGEEGRAASAMKWRLRPRERELFRQGEHEEGKDLKQAMRVEFCRHIAKWGVEWDLEVQVATDPRKHPVNDASIEWAEEGAPWIKVGVLVVPQQGFGSLKVDGLAGYEAVSSGLWGGVGEWPTFNSKELFFQPQGSSPHLPLGEVNAFRAFLYPLYDHERQEHLLGKEGGHATKCPFDFIRLWMGLST